MGYREVIKLKNLKDINIDEYQVICIPSWKIDLLKDNKFDLFINHGSFQEMEPEIVKNYLEKISPQISKYIYLENGKKGHALGKKGNFGVLEKTTREHYLTFLRDCLRSKINSLGSSKPICNLTKCSLFSNLIKLLFPCSLLS